MNSPGFLQHEMDIHDLFDKLFIKLDKIEALFAVVNLEYFFNYDEQVLRSYFSTVEELTKESIGISKDLLNFFSQRTCKDDFSINRG